jgi:hypothetical protein
MFSDLREPSLVPFLKAVAMGVRAPSLGGCHGSSNKLLTGALNLHGQAAVVSHLAPATMLLDSAIP